MIMDQTCSRKSYLWKELVPVNKRQVWLTIPIGVKGEFVRTLSLLMGEVGSRIWSFGQIDLVVDLFDLVIEVEAH